jgi:hypothetical protein
MQVIAQSPDQVTLLLFFDGLFCRFMLIFRTGINFTATAITRFFHQRWTSICTCAWIIQARCVVRI